MNQAKRTDQTGTGGTGTMPVSGGLLTVGQETTFNQSMPMTVESDLNMAEGTD